MAGVTRGEKIALGVALGACVVGGLALRWGIDKGDPRFQVARQIQHEASAQTDVVVVTEEAPEIIAALAPIPALSGVPLLRDLAGFRRLYVIALGNGALGPFQARLGPPTQLLRGAARRWDLAGLGTVVFDLGDELLEHTTVRREGGRFEGPCPRSGNLMRCHSTDDWNHVRTEPHNMDGVPIRCVWGHPQEHSQLVIEVPATPPATALVGIVGLDDAVTRGDGAPVTNHVRFVPQGGGHIVEGDVVATNHPGTTPYRFDLGGHAGTLTFSISTPNAGARQFCFTAQLTR